MQGAGYQLVTLADCLGQSPYLNVGDPSAKDVGRITFFLTSKTPTLRFRIPGYARCEVSDG